MSEKSINIKFPFRDSVKGFFLETNKLSSDAIKSDILHVLLTQKGERFYDPTFGTNLYRFLFEPNDSITLQDVKDEANSSLKSAMPNIEITRLEAVTNEHTITLQIYANNNDDIFQEEIFIEVEI